ncbi:MAG: cyclic nucleotide-binding domain-containing protein [Bdellovibrionota bacterium]
METMKSFAAGETIFKQDELGNALFVIREGQVEIVKKTDAGEVFLVIQNPGEIVGLLTFFNSGSRLASARARTAVEGQLIEREAGKDPLANLPGWIQMVLKEFSLRLGQSNDQLARLQEERASLIEKQQSRFSQSVQIADTVCELYPLFVKKVDNGREIVNCEPLIEAVDKCLGYGLEETKAIFGVFQNLGMVKVELHPDTGKEMMATNNIPRFKWYAEFVRTAKSGKNKKLLTTEIPFRYRKVIFGLRDYVQKSGGDVSKLITIDMNTLLTDFEKHTSIKPEPAAFELAGKLGILEMKRSGSDMKLSLNASLVVRTLIAINVSKRLRTDPNIKDDAEAGG